MTEEISPNDMNKALFLNLVMMLGATAMQQLGKTVNPLTNKTEVDLRGAQATIDLLAMIKNKTEGNLDTDETRLLSDTLASLQMNFVETSPSAPAQDAAEAPEPPKAEAEEGGEEASPAPEGAAEVEAPTEGGKHKEPKFHKSYE